MRPGAFSAFLRSFTIQGSWNYRTMIGCGFAFALLPVLRPLFRGREEEFQAAVARHAEHFNAHPYMATVALGAAARLEADGADPEMVRRFKDAIRGPLGGLGDALVWAGWLPATLLVGLVLGWMGAPGWLCVVLFLVLYNAGHLTLRAWGWKVGWASGREVGGALRSADLGRTAERISRLGTFLLGALTGLVLIVGPELEALGAAAGNPAGVPAMAGASSRWIWAGFAAVAFVVGVAGGQRVWRAAALAVVGAVALILSVQLF